MASDATPRSTSGHLPSSRATPSVASPSASRVSASDGIGVAVASSSDVGQSSGGGSGGAGPIAVTPRWLGKRIGRFKLMAEIGRGAMGRVFRAEDSVLARFVALKVVPTWTRDGSRSRQLERFIHEARASAGLEHPNIVTVYDVAEHKDVYAIAMELVEGGDLESLVRATAPLDPARASLLGAEAAEGLAHAHALGVLHRDIKPSNLMLSRNGRCKVCDFGLAQVMDSNDACDLNDVNKSVGTPMYTAPEVIRGQGASARSDIYSLGATLFFLLAGRAPFLAAGKAAIVKLHLTELAPDVRELNPSVPAGLAGAIAKCLAKDPAERYQDAGALAKVLRVHTIAVETRRPGVLVAARSASSAVRRLLGRRWPVAAAAGGLAAVLVVGFGIFASSRGTGDGTGDGTAAPTPPAASVSAASPAAAPASEPKPAAETAAAVVSENPTVHVSRSGTEYHAAGCRSLADSDNLIKLSDAKAKGYVACSTCAPPE